MLFNVCLMFIRKRGCFIQFLPVSLVVGFAFMFRFFLIHSDVNHFPLSVLRSYLSPNTTLPYILLDNSINLHTHYLYMWSTQKSAQSWLDVSTQIEMNEGASTPIAGA